ncbi:tyrosine-protein kinase receptor UFO, partial [Tachysurus ichikawai]
VKPSGEDYDVIHNQNVNVPPTSHLISDLKPFTRYDVRVACRSSQGVSDWTPWVTFSTNEGGAQSSSEVLPVNCLEWSNNSYSDHSKGKMFIIEHQTLLFLYAG